LKWTPRATGVQNSGEKPSFSTKIQLKTFLLMQELSFTNFHSEHGGSKGKQAL